MRNYCQFTWFLLVAILLSSVSSFGTETDKQYSTTAEVKSSSSKKITRLLADREAEDLDAARLIFESGDDAIPTLVAAIHKHEHMERAALALAYLGGPNERKVLLDAIGSESAPERQSVMAGFLAGALVEPRTEDEWSFLEKCLKMSGIGEGDFSALSAALALGTNGSARALHLLESIVNSDSTVDKEVSRAILWSKQERRPVTHSETRPNVEQIKEIILQNACLPAEEREHLSIGTVSFTNNNQRVLVSIQISRSARSAHGYDVVLVRSNGNWKISGAWFSWAA